MICKGLWYFAHPYTARDKDGIFVMEAEEANFQLANIRAAELLKRGYNIYSPISHTHPIHMACPEFLAGREHDMWYSLDNDLIAKCRFQGIIVAPGWEASTGCTHERAWFVTNGRPVKLYENVIHEAVIYEAGEFEEVKNG